MRKLVEAVPAQHPSDGRERAEAFVGDPEREQGEPRPSRRSVASFIHLARPLIVGWSRRGNGSPSTPAIRMRGPVSWTGPGVDEQRGMAAIKIPRELLQPERRPAGGWRDRDGVEAAQVVVFVRDNVQSSGPTACSGRT